jgi:hypothetical protein
VPHVIALRGSNRLGFNGDIERALAIKALGGKAGFVATNKQAVKLVQHHWTEITANVVHSSAWR